MPAIARDICERKNGNTRAIQQRQPDASTLFERMRCWSAWRPFFLDLANKAISFGANRLDQALLGAIVAYGPPGCVDAGIERRLRNNPSMPNRVEDVVSGDDPMAVANQVVQQIEGLRLDRTKHPAAA
ncbi:MAG TPA: hypothetical protein VII14_09290 [Xanthobacteraceae bacterium]